MKTKQETVVLIENVLERVKILADLGAIKDTEVEDLEFFERRLAELKDKLIARIEKR